MSGPAAGLTVVVYEIVRIHGVAALGVIVLAAGVLQIAAGMFKLGQWFRAVSPAVIHGMLAGIGVLIFASQFHVMVDDKPKENGIQNLITIPQAIAKGLPMPESATSQQRQFRTELLKDVGTLHTRQVTLRDSIAAAQAAKAPAEKNEDGQERKSWRSSKRRLRPACRQLPNGSAKTALSYPTRPEQRKSRGKLWNRAKQRWRNLRRRT